MNQKKTKEEFIEKEQTVNMGKKREGKKEKGKGKSEKVKKNKREMPILVHCSPACT